MQFSIAAINDTNSGGQWETLAPTKEAQEFHLTQEYHEGLLQLQAKEYSKAQRNFEAVLRDPLMSNAQVDGNTRDGHLLQLRFLALKNLATVFLEQGSMHYESAINCYLQAVEIDTKDSVVWNQLGTLSCYIGLLSIARWAFEQGLSCSPNNWNCMEKLLEVLIAIGDEISCLSVANLILRNWPSHARALLVKTVIEESERIPFAPRGIDRLEPKHVRLKFPNKRKSIDEPYDGADIKKKRNQTVELLLPEASLSSLVDAILKILRPLSAKGSENSPINEKQSRSAEFPSRNNELHGKGETDDLNMKGRYTDMRMRINVSSSSENVGDPFIGKGMGMLLAGNQSSTAEKNPEKIFHGKEKEGSTDEEVHPQERRSTRLERLRSRKPEKEELDYPLSKNRAEAAFQILKPFIVVGLEKKDYNYNQTNTVLLMDTLEFGVNDISRFFMEVSGNYGIYHLSHMLLEEVACRKLPFQDFFFRLLELERLTRCWSQDRTFACSLFLSEVYYDLGSSSANESKRAELFSEAFYHLCKVVELISLDIPAYSALSSENLKVIFGRPVGKNDLKVRFDENTKQNSNYGDPNEKTHQINNCGVSNDNIKYNNIGDSNENIHQNNTYGDSNKKCQHDNNSGNSNESTLQNNSGDSNELAASKSFEESTVIDYSVLPLDNSFWVRFHWLSGRLLTYSGNDEKAYEEFERALSLLKNAGNMKETLPLVLLPHCKLVKAINIERLQHEINLLKVHSLLRNLGGKTMTRESYSGLAKLFSPLLLSAQDIYLDQIFGAYSSVKGVASVELSALDILISACENAVPLENEVYLSCHRRKLHILSVAAGILESVASCNLPKKPNGDVVDPSYEPEAPEFYMRECWNHMVAQEVNAIYLCLSHLKDEMDETSGISEKFSAPAGLLGDIQYFLLVIICNLCQRFTYQKSSEVGTDYNAQLETKCFMESAIAFCKLQHLDPDNPAKSQVELIAAMHELLAEYGLCCAGKDGDGEEGAFLKLAIKYLLALDVKLRSNSHSSSRKQEKAQGSEVLSVSDPTSSFFLERKENEAIDIEATSMEKHETKMIIEQDPPNALLIESFLNASEKEKDGAQGKDGISDKLMKTDGCNADNGNLTTDAAMNKVEEAQGKDGRVDKLKEIDSHSADMRNVTLDAERNKVELGIDNALDQCFFCLYGLNLKGGPDASDDDDLAIHRNTNRGEYQSKEQCADVFRYLLPYAKASSRAGLVKLRRVLRAIYKHFPHPPDDILMKHSIDRFLDDPDLSECKLCEMVISCESVESIITFVFPDRNATQSGKAFLIGSSDSYQDVYGNLYYFLAQAEEMNATDKWPGFVLTKEGEEFVEQNANLFKYDLLYNPFRFESWQRLANIYDEEVDLLLNDGSKHINVVEWRRSDTLPQRVQASRRRSRRCLLMSLALAKTPVEQSQIHELLALVYYDSLQNVVPFYDQRCVLPVRDETWTMYCRNSMKHFEKAFAYKSDWSHAFYLGKLCEKLSHTYEEAFSYYSKASSMNPCAVDPVYRMHASRMKLLYACGKHDFHAIKVVAAHSFHQSTKDTILNLLGWTAEDLELLCKTNVLSCVGACPDQEEKLITTTQLEKAWSILFNDCIMALEVCVEGELKHFHKARYMLAQGLYRRGEDGDLERAKEELSFCFKSSRSSFTINMWEIDSIVKKARRRTPGIGGNKKVLELGLPESSRKFITCIRKYILLYLTLLEKTEDFGTLERAYSSLRTDKRFSLCLEDIVPVALGRYAQALALSVNRSVIPATGNAGSLDHLLERIFNIFLDHGSSWTDFASLPELGNSLCPEFSVDALYSYIHKYVQSLERDVRLDTLELINEKIRKRFKNPRLSNTRCAKVCNHASAAWCRSIVLSLASITSLPEEPSPTQIVAQATGDLDPGWQLHVDIQDNELWNTTIEDPKYQKSMEVKRNKMLKIKNIPVKQASAENMETASTLLKCTYNFYRESYCGTLPSGVNLYIIATSRLAPRGLSLRGTEGVPFRPVVETLDLSISRKLLLWAYTLVHGHYLNIHAVVKHCEENVKTRMKKGSSTSLAPPALTTSTLPSTVAGVIKEINNEDTSEPVDKQGVVSSSNGNENTNASLAVTSSNDIRKKTPQLHQGNALEEQSAPGRI
ncbi:hypothetical protein AMTR_s00042p00226140 [Amborella trichopoda]|uniref:Calcineurin-binding protein cabin-1 n=1 Tax=Amborella trichopoda TaxID=13333 RepID=W1P7Q2_AMBTC|nr:hypothetical protein AMTR_s00042p00226140 [Amborella trichopoda]